MKKIISVVSAALLFFTATVFTACGGSSGAGSIKWPEFPLAENNGTPSWKQGEKSDLAIDWYVDRSSFVWTGADNSVVADKIYEETGIRINFQTPLNDDGQMLNTILNSGKMPDLITINVSNTTRVQMQEEGYAYPVGGLAERWAPGLTDNFSDEIAQIYAATDGECYGIPSLYYSYDDIEAFKSQGQILQSNASFIARKDYLDWYTSTYPGADPTTPSGFIEMCKAVKKQFNVKYTIATDAFTTTADNTAIYRLAQYFAVPRENPDGTLTYLEGQEGFYDCLAFLNECWREGLIDETNFSNTKNQQSNIVQRGSCFVFMGVPQDYGTAIKEFARTGGSEYVGIVITNENGDAPVMADLSGNGDMFTMVTKDCDRPDRVAKLLDYLTSEEGQMLCFFGVEGEHWNYTVRPGERVTEDGMEKTFVFGRAEWTDEVWKKINNKTTADLGILSFQLMCVNKAQKKLAMFDEEELYNWATYLVYNCKAVLSDWVYSFKPLSVANIRDANGKNYLEITTKATNLQLLWRERVSQIITANSEADCRSAYLSALARAEQYGCKEVLEYDNDTFQRIKKIYGFDYAWAPLQEEYDPVEVTSIYGNTSYCKSIPDFIPRT